MNTQHKPGRICNVCEGFCLQPTSPRIDAGVEMSFRIGQRVRHRDYKSERVTGVVMSLSIDGEQGLMVSIALDAPIVIPPGDGYSAINIYRQTAPAHEFSPFDERDELVAEMLSALKRAKTWIEQEMEGKGYSSVRIQAPPIGSHLCAINAAIVKAQGGAT